MQEHKVTRQMIAEDRFLAQQTGLHSLAFKKPTGTKLGKFCIFEFKCMSDATDQYLQRAQQTAEKQYDSLYIALIAVHSH